MTRFTVNTLHPERYQGARRKYPYFEGWYYKLVDAYEQHRLAVIPGIYKEPSPEMTHAFVQVIDGMNGRVNYFCYPAEAFQAEPGDFDVRIDFNRFRVGRINLQLEGPGHIVRGSLEFNGVPPWPVSLRSPGVMRWYAWVPFMECYHGVISLDHIIKGTLEIAGTPVDFTGERGCTEKDWRRRFPAAWVWFQSNHFDTLGISLTVSVALIPWLRSTFRCFIVGLWHAGTLYRFTTYAGATIERLRVDEDVVEWVLRSPHHRLELRVQRADTAILYTPDLTDMTGRVAETMRSTAWVRLIRRDRPNAPILGRLSDRFGRKPLLLVSLAGTVVGFLMLGLARSLTMLFASRIVEGFLGGNISLAQAYISDVTEGKKRSKGFGLGFIIAPALGGTFSAGGDYGLPALIAAGLSTLNFMGVLLRLPESLPPEEREWRKKEPRTAFSPSLEVLLVVLAPLALAFGVLGALLMAWLVYYTWRRALFMPDLAYPVPKEMRG